MKNLSCKKRVQKKEGSDAGHEKGGESIKSGQVSKLILSNWLLQVDNSKAL